VSTAADRFAGLDDYVTDAMEKWQVPGVAIAVVKDGEKVVSRAYGEQRVDARNEPITLDTRFSIASCTKSFTACAIAIRQPRKGTTEDTENTEFDAK
jgi:CubicO group peptidase (beta-lactamase class C family)